MQMPKHKFWLISGLAKLTRDTKITAEMQLIANIIGWKMAGHCKYCCPLLEQEQRHIFKYKKLI